MAAGRAAAFAKSAAVALGAASAFGSVPPSNHFLVGGPRRQPVTAEVQQTRQTPAGRFCLDTAAAGGRRLAAAQQLARDQVPIGQVVSVLECYPNGVVQYEVGSASKPCAFATPAAASPTGHTSDKVCFDYAVVLSGRVDQYLGGTSGATSFPKIMGPGGFLTELAVLHNSWQVPCQIALVRLTDED